MSHKKQTDEERKLGDKVAAGYKLSREEQARMTELIIERMPQEYFSLQESRKAKKARQGYLIDTLLPEATVHLIGGPSGIGKSTWLLQTIHDWERGIPIMGFPSHPMPYVYFMCDRSEVDLQSTLEQIGLGDWDIKAYAIESLGRRPFLMDPQDVKIENLPKIFPWAKIFFIEAIHWFYQNKSSHGGKDYVDTLRFWSHVRDQFCENDLTIIGTTHVPKMKANEGYVRARDKIFGSVAGPAVAGTIIVMDDNPKAPGKVEMTICPRNSKEFKVEYQRAKNGALQFIGEVGDTTTPVDTGAFSIFDKRLSTLEPDSIVSSGVINEWQRDIGVSHKTAQRWVRAKREEGRLVVIEPGKEWKIKRVSVN